MSFVKFLYSRSQKSNDLFISKYILIYSQIFKKYKEMTSPTCSDDFLVIDTSPSPVLIDIDKPPNHKLPKSGISDINKKVSFKISPKYKFGLSRFNPVHYSKSQHECFKASSSKALDMCDAKSFKKKANLKNSVEELTSPILIDIDEQKGCEPNKDIERIHYVGKLEKGTLLEHSSVDKSLIVNKTCNKKVQQKKSISHNEPVLIELDISDQEEEPVLSNTKKSASNNNRLIQDYKLGKFKNVNMKKLRLKKKQKFGKKCTNRDDQDIIPVCEIYKSSREFLPLDVSKETLLNIHFQKSKTYMQKRNFCAGKTCQEKRLSKEYESDSNSTSDSCTEVDKSYSLSDDESKDDYKSDSDVIEIETKNNKSDTDLNNAESSVILEKNSEMSDEINKTSLKSEFDEKEYNSSNRDGSDYDSEECNNYDNVSMDLSSESDNDSLINVENSDYVPFSGFKVNDLEFCPPISDEILNKRKKLEALRKWELTGLGNEMVHMNKKQNGSLFTLLSYNVLSQQLIKDNIHLYENCDKKFLEWSYRWPLLQYEIKHLEPDIIAFQEVEGAHYHTHYRPWFKYLGYNCIYKKKTGTKVDGCLIAYNSKKFDVIEENSVEYNQPNGKNHLNRDNIGLIVKFTHTSFHSPFCVATTHLLFNPKRHDVRLAQMAVFLTELDRICYLNEENGSPKYCPIILTGDFNSNPHSPLLKFIKYGSLNYSNTTNGSPLLPTALGVSQHCQHKSLSQGRYLQNLRGELFSLIDKRKIEETLIKLSHSEREKKNTSDSTNTNLGVSGIINHGFKFKSVYYPNLLRLPSMKAVTTFQDRWITVDYIFYTKILKNQKCIEGELKLIARYGLLGEDEAKALGPLPTDVCPSDHFPLAAQFFLKQS